MLRKDDSPFEKHFLWCQVKGKNSLKCFITYTNHLRFVFFQMLTLLCAKYNVR